MKKIALLLPLLVLPLVAHPQKTPVDNLFKKYYGKKGFTTVLVNKAAFEVISKQEKSKGNFEGSLGKIDRVRVIAQEDDSNRVEGVNFMEELKSTSFEGYKELVVVKESDEEVMVLAKQDGEVLTELLILVSGKDNVMVSVEGRFNMEDLEELSQLQGLEGLDKIIDP
jgi:hypothetical protein